MTDPWTGHTRHFDVVHFTDEVGQIRDLTAITDRNGNRIDILRDQDGTPAAVEHPGYSIAVDTVATAAGPRIAGLRILDTTGADSGTITKQFRYDDRGRLTGVINSSGLPFTYEWDDTDRITAWRDRVGYRFGYIYDHLGRVDPTAKATSWAAPSGTTPPTAPPSTPTPSATAQPIVYDENGHVATETDPLGNTTHTEHRPLRSYPVPHRPPRRHHDLQPR